MQDTGIIVTIFRNIKETTVPFHRDVTEIFERIRQEKVKDLVNKIRSADNPSLVKSLKDQLPSICFSGIFYKREDDALIAHSGLICLDFDKYATDEDMLADRQRFEQDEYVYCLFVSPSGNGLKVLVKIPHDPDNHKLYFNALRQHFDSEHFDEKCSNVSRVCYESIDPDIYVNEDSKVWDVLADDEPPKVVKGIDRPTIPISDMNDQVAIVVKWWEKNYPMTSGQRNHNAFTFAMKMNEIGASRDVTEQILMRYAEEDFPDKEIGHVIDSAYRHTEKHNTVYFENTRAVKQIKEMVRKGKSKEDIKYHFSETDIPEEKIEAVVEEEENKSGQVRFWKTSDNGRLYIDSILFKEFMEGQGYRKYNPPGSDNYIFIQIKENLIDNTNENEIKDYVLNYLMDNKFHAAYNFMADRTKYFKEDYLSMLASVNIHFIEDKKEKAYLYYRNCAIEISKHGIKRMEYSEMPGYVWKEHVIQRDYRECKNDKCDFKVFVHNISGGNKDRIRTMESTIGYLMHGYKNRAYCPAVILNDEMISDNPEGGTGKGLLFTGISQIKKVVIIDGKSFNFDRTFAFQLVTPDTQILLFDDVKQSFEFVRLFSVITEGITVEKKNKDAIKIPFHHSPKIGITTNYAIRGSGNSFERRKWEVELHQHYDKQRTPIDEFGRLMFADWDEQEWCRFDSYMISCLQGYLKTGLVLCNFVNLAIRKLISDTCYEFAEWCGEVSGIEASFHFEVGIRLYSDEMYDSFIRAYPDFDRRGKRSVSRTMFNKWTKIYCKFKSGHEPDEGKDHQGRYIEMKYKNGASATPSDKWVKEQDDLLTKPF